MLLYHENEAWKKENLDNSFDVTMGSYDIVEVNELFGTLLLSTSNSIPKEISGLHRDDGLILIRNENEQKRNRIKKEVIKRFKEIGFKIKIKTNLKVGNLQSIQLYINRKPKNNLLYINYPKLLSSYQYQQPKDFPQIHQLQKFSDRVDVN